MIHNTRISIIAAIGENRELGVKNQLLWHIPGELKRFKDITIGHPIIMGRKTFESIGRILPGRTNIIITRDKFFDPHKFGNCENCDAFVVNSLDEAIQKAQADYGLQTTVVGSQLTVDKEKEVFIIGGGQIFTEALPITDRLYLTLVHKSFPQADVFFPLYPEFKKIISKQEMTNPELSYTFLTLER